VASTQQELVGILEMTRGLSAVAERALSVSGYLLGRPYVAHPLVGSPAHPEQLVLRLDGFDCVTFVETVLALARSRKPEDVLRQLVALRYEAGEVGWSTRNHYMSDWVARNVAAGLVEPVLAEHAVEVKRRLSTLSGYPARTRQFRYVPLECCGALKTRGRPGDLVGFVSTRAELDTFHVGLLAAGESTMLRHASRSAGEVVEEPLASFLDRNETPGLLLARPTELEGERPS
jgi:hypothetical protein